MNGKKKIVHKDLIKRINYQLKNNFFSIHEFSELSFRKAYKVIKLISKINGIKLKRSQMKSITDEIQAINLEKSASKIKVKIIAPLFN